MKSIPNGISLIRIFLAFAFFLIEPLSTSFFVIYFICGVSDILDGYIARKTNTGSKFGEKLDSIADLIMVTVLIIRLYPIIDIPITISYWVIGIAVIRVMSMGIVLIKHKTFGIIHTTGNKITGFMLFLFPLIIQLDALIYLLCIVASISAIEELLINLVSREFNGNRKSILHKVRYLD
ncbi:CDP-diacylglycerol--glycerol-3-phosphate 3-phosphatidyltransferase [Natranaerovirga pectinivora]|uniref:Phosphatidylglycerophosphate synthase n=1 Tax=Natranaerovirga pectinivora TaxID=682400 RepID=A0A4V2V0Q2_9FIRM|nr:CDP-alcohol phosphatidyltransferase family protein [Natranaerovirga pectinivora]TCT17219.1 CDP-diacylglycerol--glycerol-3-phosphate 3-phosphatidyltransferase [Natranaerovirga pectinivora]